jgi:hypothetical protein
MLHVCKSVSNKTCTAHDHSAFKTPGISRVACPCHRPTAHLLLCAPGALPVQLMVTLPFQIVCALVFDFTMYGMAGLRTGDGAMWKNGTLMTLLYLVAVQVGRVLGEGGRGLAGGGCLVRSEGTTLCTLPAYSTSRLLDGWCCLWAGNNHEYLQACPPHMSTGTSGCLHGEALAASWCC